MRNTEDIRKILMDELDSLVKGESSIDRANSVSKLSAQAIYATRMELENKRSEIAIGHLFGQVRWDKIDGLEVTLPKLTMGDK
ncbi:hypothetical protein OAE88_00495 [bacterium]|nr:hypothetical protein [bacterium]